MFCYMFIMSKYEFHFRVAISEVVILILLPCVVKADVLKCDSRSYVNGSLVNSPISEALKHMIIQCFGQEIKANECTVSQFYKSSGGTDLADCTNLDFSSTGSEGFLSDIGILPYNTDGFYNYNISFTNIQWDYVRVRVLLSDAGAGEGEGVFCMELQMEQNFSPGAALSLAHRHWGPWAGGFTAQVQLQTEERRTRQEGPRGSSKGKGYARFLFRVPAMVTGAELSTIAAWVPLVALEISRSPLLEVVWAQLPPHFNVSSYVVQLEGDDPQVVKTEDVCDGVFCRRELDAGYSSRAVKSLVRPVHLHCDQDNCLWETPIIHLEFPVPWYVLALLMALPVLVALTFTFTVYFFCCKLPPEPVPVLFLLDATEKRHKRAARILGEFLEETANIRILYAAKEVPRSASKNASKWLQEAVEEVPLALVVASPFSPFPIRYTGYPNVFSEALPLLEKRQRCAAHRARGALTLVAVPPYLMKDDIPEQLRRLPAFHVPSQMRQLIWTLYNPRAASIPLLRAIAFCWLRWVGCPGPVNAYRHCGMRLSEALTIAGAVQTIEENPPSTPGSGSDSDDPTLPFSDKDQSYKDNPYPGKIESYLHGAKAEKESLANSEASAAPHEAPPNGAIPIEVLLRSTPRH